MFTWTAKRLALCLVVATNLATFACAEAAPQEAKSPGAQGSIAWVGFLTSGRDYSIWIDASPRRLRKDPTYGRLLTDALAKVKEKNDGPRCLFDIATSVSYAERVIVVAGSAKSGVLVAGGLPADFEVGNVMCDGKPVWAPSPPTATGIRELQVKEPPPGTTVTALVLPDGTVVLGFGESAKPVHALLDRSSAPAFPTEMKGKLGELRIQGNVLAAARIQLEASPLAPASEALRQVSLIAWDNEDAKIGLALRYADGDHAGRAQAFLQRVMDAAVKDGARLSFSQDDSVISADLPRTAVERLVAGARR
jgi:hypothetical protein